MFERFTHEAIKVIMLAQEEARRLGINHVGTEQIFLGIIGEGSSTACKALKNCGINIKEARQAVEKLTGRGNGFVAVEIPFTANAKRSLEAAWEFARQQGQNFIEPKDLLVGVLSRSEGKALATLATLNGRADQVRSELAKILDKTLADFEMTLAELTAPDGNGDGAADGSQASTTSGMAEAHSRGRRRCDCPWCDTEMSAGAALCPSCQRPQGEHAKRCPQCAEIIWAEARICRYCKALGL
ncbi:MAG: hypothetical protein KGS72_27365 [Cyanobacteria bacterium REEB67]|nr:hypothetical protein [Cyanobacteria bacterium REEB67]